MKRIMLRCFWVLIHLLVSIVHLVTCTTHRIESYLILIAQPEKYNHLQVNRLRYLVVVVDSEEALCLSKVVELLCWLSAIGVKHVCLYDAEGVLKKHKEILLKNVLNMRLPEGPDKKDVPKEEMTVELLSLNGKEATAKAASFLYSQHLQGSILHNGPQDPSFTEDDMEGALKAVGILVFDKCLLFSLFILPFDDFKGRLFSSCWLGCWGPEPDILLIYGEARSHLGFPAWRLQYTEIIHMGT